MQLCSREPQVLGKEFPAWPGTVQGHPQCIQLNPSQGPERDFSCSRGQLSCSHQLANTIVLICGSMRG